MMTGTEAHQRPRVLLADDYPGLHPAIARLLSPTCDVVGHVLERSQLFDAAVRIQPDVIVVDLGMLGVSGLDDCREIRIVVPHSKLIVYSAIDRGAVVDRVIQAGASAFVSKTRLTHELVPAIHTACASAA